MDDPGRRETDRKLAEMEKHLHEVYTQAYEELNQKTEDYFKRFREKDEAKRALVRQGKLSPKEYENWRKGQMFVGDHWIRMRDQAAQDLYNVNKTAIKYINGQLPDIYAMNYNASAADIENGMAHKISFEMTNPAVVRDLSLAGDKLLLPYKQLDPKKDIPWNMRNINAAMLQGILQGESIPEIAKRFIEVGVQNEIAAVRAARTMTTTVENRARLQSALDAQASGIIMGKIWMSIGDERTRPWHAQAARDYASPIPLEEPFVVMGEEMDAPGDTRASGMNVYNCFVGETNIATDSEVIRSYKHNYSGRFVTVKTAGGVNFTCTPNHPILTIGGWVPAESLQKGNDILVAFRRNDVLGRIDPNINHVFPRIDAIHELFNMMGGDRTVSMSVNFHGDISTSDVEIITKKRLLREGRNSGAFNSINKFLLKHSDKSFLRLRSFSKHFGRIWSSALGFVGGVSKSLPFFFTGLRHPEIHRLRPIALLYSGRVKPLDNDAARNAELISECIDGFSGFVFADNIVSVDFSSGCSHVYNLQTENGYYFVNSSMAQSKRKSNGIFAIAHNCRCSLGRRVLGFKSILPKDKQGSIKVRFLS